VPIAALTALAGAPGFVLAYDALLALAAFVTWKLGPSTSGLRLSRRFDPVLSVRVPNRVVLTLENDGVEPVKGLLRDEPPGGFLASRREFPIDLAPGRAQEIEYTVTPIQRGKDAFQGTFLRLACPMGLVEKQVRLETEEPVRVYPNVLALREFGLLKQQGRLREMGIRRSRARGIGTEFESLREYAEGDDFRKIDHKASARRGKLVVRQYEQERNQSVILCIDVGRHMLAEVGGVRKLDHVLDAILMLANAAAIAGDFVGLLVYADDVRRYIPPKKGRAQVAAVIDAIHDLEAEPVETDPLGAFAYLGLRCHRRSLLVNFTDWDDPDRARDLVAAFRPMARRHLALMVHVQDPRLDEATAGKSETVEDLYRKAAAEMLLEDRREAVGIVESAGIHVVRTEPQDLAASLVNFYFTVKEKSLL
jgi:uncharacterized protein (DUF58 family)